MIAGWPPTSDAAASASRTPFGHETTPSPHAASIMFWAARPASSARGHTIATASAAVLTFSGAQTVSASASRSETTTNSQS
jgi:hypothetical protein